MNKLDVSNKKLNEVVNSLNDGILVATSEAIITMANQKAIELSGFDGNELAGKSLTNLIFDYAETAHDATVDNIVKNGIEFNVIKKCVTKCGEEIPIIFSCMLMSFDDNSKFIVCVLHKITKLQSCDELYKEDDESDAGDINVKKMKISAMCGEIEEHAKAVTELAELICETNESGRVLKGKIDDMLKSTKWILSMAGNLIDFVETKSSKNEAGKIDFNLRTLVEGVRSLFDKAEDDNDIKFACLATSNLPVVVRCDPWIIRRMLTNLAGNAIDCMDNGEATIHASLVDENDRSTRVRLELSVIGEGIHQKNIEMMYKSGQLENETLTYIKGRKRFDLSILLEIAGLFNGNIGVESKAGNDATIWFIVEMEKQGDINQLIPLSAEQVKSLNILTFIENEAASKDISAMLDSLECKHNCVTTGDDMLKMLDKTRGTKDENKLILFDFNTAESCIEKMSSEIKDCPGFRQLQLIMIISCANRGDAKKAEDAGFGGFLTKPVTEKELFNCIAAVMGFRKKDKDGNVELITRHMLNEQVEQNRARVLLVEDNRVNQMKFVFILENEGYNVDIANNGAEAIKTLQKHFYDIVFMDCYMPVMDGFETTAAIRELDGCSKYVPIVALTVESPDSDAYKKCIDIGMNDYITKPFNKSDLLKAINKFLDDELAPEESIPEMLHESEDEIFDKEAAINKVDGDIKLLIRISKQFFNNCPKQLANIKDAVKARDGIALMHTGHAIKSGVSNLFGKSVFKAALEIEIMGRDSEFGDIDAKYAVLENEINLLQRKIEEDLY